MCLVVSMRTFHESASRVYDPPPRDFAAAGREACFHKMQVYCSETQWLLRGAGGAFSV